MPWGWHRRRHNGFVETVATKDLVGFGTSLAAIEVGTPLVDPQLGGVAQSAILGRWVLQALRDRTLGMNRAGPLAREVEDLLRRNLPEGAAPDFVTVGKKQSTDRGGGPTLIILRSDFPSPDKSANFVGF